MSDNYQRSTWSLTDIECPLDNDVVCGRGGLANNHKGNKRFRSIVNTFKPKYAACSRHEKTAMAEDLVRKWRGQTPPGRFLKLDKTTGMWNDVGKAARAKCSQLLREKIDSKDEDKFDEDVDATPEMDMSVPPPPPYSANPNDSESCISPPQTRPTRDVTPRSPDSVMDMPFFSVESVAKAATVRRQEAGKAFSKMMQGFKLPSLPRRERLMRCNSHCSNASDAAEPVEGQGSTITNTTPLGSFLGNLIPKGTKLISILQDNATGSPIMPTTTAMPEFSTDSKLVVEHNVAPMQLETSTLPCFQKEARVPVSDMRPTMAFCSKRCDIPRPNYLSGSKRDRSISVELESLASLGDTEHSVSWKSLDMLDFENDPILNKYARQLEMSSHASARSRSSTATFSVDSSISTMDSLMEDIGSLHELFRERCTSSDVGRMNAIQCWEAAYGGDVVNDDDSQPDLDDMSVVSSESFFDDEAITTPVQQAGSDDVWDDGSCRIHTGTRRTAFSMDSDTLDLLLE